MTTLDNRPNTALLVVDMQNAVVEDAYERERVVTNIRHLLDGARAAGVPVIWSQHSDDQLAPGSDAWDIVSELTPAEREPVIHKGYSDAFEGSDLEQTLATLGIGRLILAGAETGECIRATLHGAFVRGYDATLVADAHTMPDLTEWGSPPPETVIAYTNFYWANHAAPGRAAGTLDTADVRFEASR